MILKTLRKRGGVYVSGGGRRGKKRGSRRSEGSKPNSSQCITAVSFSDANIVFQYSEKNELLTSSELYVVMASNREHTLGRRCIHFTRITMQFKTVSYYDLS